MGLKHQLFSVIQRFSARLGYPIIANWRLEKWDESRHMRELFAMLDVGLVLDVGANVGQYHEFLRLHVGYEGRVVSFEPIGELYERLQQASRLDPHWSVRRLALGETDGETEINVTVERTLSSLLPRNEAALRSMGYEKYLRETELARTETIPVRRLDAIFDEVVPAGSRSVFLKSDTQGFDMAVIRGAHGCLPRLSAIQIELPIRPVYQGTQDYLDSLAELSALGFEVTALFPVQRDATLRIVNVDAVMIRGDVAERLRAEKRHAPGHAGRP